MRTFAAQLKTTDTDLDVTVTLSERNVQITTSEKHLGVWSTQECEFERRARRAYTARLGNDQIDLRVLDDRGFRRALALIRQEQGSLIPRPVLWIGLSAVGAAVVAGTLLGGESLAEAQPKPVVSPTVAAPPTSTPPTQPVAVEPAPTPPSAPSAQAGDLIDRWNELAGGSTLRLARDGVNETADVEVTVGDGTIQVDAVPTGAADNAERIMAALGLTIGSIDPALAPSERATILTRLGLRVNAPNLDPVDNGLVHNGVSYHLWFEPGTSVRFQAGLEW